MKKFLYVILVLVVLLGLAYVLKGQKSSVENTQEAVAVEEEATVDNGAVVEEEVVVVDEEPVAEENATVETEAVDENVVEENPEDTADEGETVVD